MNTTPTPKREKAQAAAKAILLVAGLGLLSSLSLAFFFTARPVVVVDSLEKVLSPKKEGEEVQESFLLSNKGRADLIIDDIVATSPCCSRVSSCPKTVRPGETGRVVVQVTPSRYGMLAAGFVVRTNAPDRPEINLRVTALPTSTPPFFVLDSPGPIRLGEVWKPGSLRQFSFQTVERHKDSIWVESVRCDHPSIEVTQAASPEIKLSGRDFVLRQYRYDIAVREMPDSGPLKASLLIKTQESEKSVPLNADVVLPVRLVPSALFIADASVDYSVHVLSRDLDSQLHAELEDAPPWLQARKGDKPSPASEQFFVQVKMESIEEDCDGILGFRVNGILLSVPVYCRLTKTTEVGEP